MGLISSCESQRILKQQICIIFFKFGWNSNLLMLQNLFVVAPFKEHWAQCQSLLQANCQHVSEVFLFACLLYELQDVGATAFPSKRQTCFEVSAACFEFCRAYFLFVLFFGSLAPVEDNNEKKYAQSHTANDRQTNSNNTKKEKENLNSSSSWTEQVRGKTVHRLHVCHCSHHFYSL